MKKIFSLLIVLLTLNQTYASNPFDVLYYNVPDFVIKEISQEKDSNQIRAYVCNVGGTMDQYGDIAIGIKNNSSWEKITTLIYGVKFDSGNCVYYRVGTVEALGIKNNSTYSLKGQVKIKYYKNERNTKNNYLTQSVYLSVGTYYYNNTYSSDLPDLTVKNLDYFETTNISEYNSSREIKNAIVAEICNVGSSFSQVGVIKVNFRGPNNTDIGAYINSYNSFWNSNECRKVAVNANDVGIGYNSSYNVSVRVDDTLAINERYENNNSIMKTLYVPSYYNYNNFSNNLSSDSYYCNGVWYRKDNNNGYSCNGTYYPYNNYDNNYSNRYYCNGSRYYYDNNATSYYCNGSRYSRNNYINNSTNNSNNNDMYYCEGNRYYFYNATSYYCNGSRYSRDNYNSNGNYSDIDLKIDSITSNNSSRRLYANICNIGGDMPNYYVIKTIFYSSSTGKSYEKRNSLKINRGNCSTGEISINYRDLGIYYSGYVSINAKIYIEGYSEKNTSNNEKTESLQVNP